MVKFWLNELFDLLSLENLVNPLQDNNKIFNLLSLLVIIVSSWFTVNKKEPKYIGVGFIFLCIIILIRINMCPSTNFGNVSKFAKVDEKADAMLTNQYLLDIKLVQNIEKGNNKAYVDNVLNINKGDIILITNNINSETNVVANIQNTFEYNNSAIIFQNNFLNVYSKETTKLYKVSDSSPNIINPPDPNRSIKDSNPNSLSSDPISMGLNSAPRINVPNGNSSDWNLELSSYIPGEKTKYEYQGQPFGPLKCRKSSETNPMATINVTEYDAAPTMCGTCNVGDLTTTDDGKVVNNDYLMTDNFEKTISMRVNDLLFHKGNSQSRFSPMPVDTLPDNQEAFAHFCYRNPTNLVNPKYASIFVNDPEAFKLVTKLAKATGTENGGPGGK